MPRTLSSETVQVDDAFAAIDQYFERDWTDGLPIVPPTPEAVDAFLAAAKLTPDEVIGVEPTKGAVVTAEKAAINAVMAGCKPEYMPVVVAAVQAMTQPQLSLHAITVSTMGAAPLLVVNGPIVEKIGLKSGVSVFGPGNRANATIGRAIRLIIINVLGTVAGVLDRATLGHAGKYTWCIAEAERDSPWQPLHVDRGCPEGSSAVSVFAGLSPFQVGQQGTGSAERILNGFIDPLQGMGAEMQEIVLVLCPEHLAFFRDEGWTKRQIGKYLHEASKRPAHEWTARERAPAGESRAPDEPVSALKSPDALVTIVAGGPGGAWSALIPTWTYGARSRSATQVIKEVTL